MLYKDSPVVVCSSRVKLDLISCTLAMAEGQPAEPSAIAKHRFDTHDKPILGARKAINRTHALTWLEPTGGGGLHTMRAIVPSASLSHGTCCGTCCAANEAQ